MSPAGQHHDHVLQKGFPRTRETRARGVLPPAPHQHHPAVPLPTWNVLVLVFLKMPVQVGLLPKASVTQVTFERLLLVMDVSNVPLEVGGNAE